MTTYRVEGCLGVTVGSVDSIAGATALVLKEIPISDKTVSLTAGRLAKKPVGGKVHIDYGGTGCTVFVEE